MMGCKRLRYEAEKNFWWNYIIFYEVSRWPKRLSMLRFRFIVAVNIICDMHASDDTKSLIYADSAHRLHIWRAMLFEWIQYDRSASSARKRHHDFGHKSHEFSANSVHGRLENITADPDAGSLLKKGRCGVVAPHPSFCQCCAGLVC